MTSARPLRDLLADLAGDADAARAHGGDPQAYLAAHGHPDLPADLVAEAVVSYADTAPAEVAEHLAPFVTAHTGAEVDATADLFGLLTSAPVGEEESVDDLDPMLDELPDGDMWSGDLGPDPDQELDFGTGSSTEDGVGFAADDADPAETAEASAEPDTWPTAEPEPPLPTPAPDDLPTPDDEADDPDEDPNPLA